jgi:hypothetical protein
MEMGCGTLAQKLDKNQPMRKNGLNWSDDKFAVLQGIWIAFSVWKSLCSTNTPLKLLHYIILSVYFIRNSRGNCIWLYLTVFL